MIKLSQDLVGGTVLLAIAAFVLLLNAKLPLGTVTQLGPGMLPFVVCILIGICGLVLVLSAFIQGASGIESIGWRGVTFVSLSLIVFAMTIGRLGLAIAVPGCVLVAGLAIRDFRWRWVIGVAVLMTLVCVFVFRYALHLPMPLLVIPGFLRI
jgi:putative tricarboxylic transport membrane protein